MALYRVKSKTHFSSQAATQSISAGCAILTLLTLFIAMGKQIIFIVWRRYSKNVVIVLIQIFIAFWPVRWSRL